MNINIHCIKSTCANIFAGYATELSIAITIMDVEGILVSHVHSPGSIIFLLFAKPTSLALLADCRSTCSAPSSFFSFSRRPVLDEMTEQTTQTMHDVLFAFETTSECTFCCDYKKAKRTHKLKRRLRARGGPQQKGRPWAGREAKRTV